MSRYEPDFDSFQTMPEWVNIIEMLKEMEKQTLDEMIRAAAEGNTNQVQFLAGRVAQMREFAEFPNYMRSTVRYNQSQGGRNATNEERQ